MTKVIIDSGICGFTVTVVAEEGDDKKVHITVESQCEMIKKMAEDITSLEMMTAFTGHLNNQVYRAAAKHIKHLGCQAPAGIIKALEVELGLCLPKDTHIHFIKD